MIRWLLPSQLSGYGGDNEVVTKESEMQQTGLVDANISQVWTFLLFSSATENILMGNFTMNYTENPVR